MWDRAKANLKRDIEGTGRDRPQISEPGHIEVEVAGVLDDVLHGVDEEGRDEETRVEDGQRRQEQIVRVAHRRPERAPVYIFRNPDGPL